MVVNVIALLIFYELGNRDSLKKIEQLPQKVANTRRKLSKVSSLYLPLSH